MNRDRVDRALDGLVVIGEIRASSVTDENTVLVTMVGEGPADVDVTQDHADADDVEQVPGCEVWGHAPLFYRPAAPNDEGAPEALCLRIGDAREVIATKDRRWQESLEEGDVVLTWMGVLGDAERRAVIRLKADGVVEIQGAVVKIGTPDAEHPIPWGDVLRDFLSDLKTWVDGHKHVYLDDGVAALTTVPATVVLPPHLPFDTSPDVPSMLSDHLVE